MGHRRSAKRIFSRCLGGTKDVHTSFWHTVFLLMEMWDWQLNEIRNLFLFI